MKVLFLSLIILGGSSTSWAAGNLRETYRALLDYANGTMVGGKVGTAKDCNGKSITSSIITIYDESSTRKKIPLVNLIQYVREFSYRELKQDVASQYTDWKEKELDEDQKIAQANALESSPGYCGLSLRDAKKAYAKIQANFRSDTWDRAELVVGTSQNPFQILVAKSSSDVVKDNPKLAPKTKDERSEAAIGVKAAEEYQKLLLQIRENGTLTQVANEIFEIYSFKKLITDAEQRFNSLK